jgi:hypothetical protein
MTSMKLCEKCSPKRVEQLSKYYGSGTCQACESIGELYGFNVSTVLNALRAASARAAGQWEPISDENLPHPGCLVLLRLADNGYVTSKHDPDFGWSGYLSAEPTHFARVVPFEDSP